MSARKRRTAKSYVDVRPYAGVAWIDSATIAERSTPISRRRKKLRWKLAGGCSSGWDLMFCIRNGESGDPAPEDEEP